MGVGFILFVLIALIIVMYILVKYRFNATIRHELINVNIPLQQAIEVVNEAFGGVKPWNPIDGPGDINRKYSTFFNVVEGPTISVAFETLEDGQGTNVDVWMSNGVIKSRQKYFIKTEVVKFDGKVRAIKKKILRALVEHGVSLQD